MIDYTSIIGALNRVIKAETNRPVVPQGSTQKQPPYPFCTYTVTSPYLPQTSIDDGETLTEDVEMVVSLTWCSEDAMEAASLAQQTATLLKLTATRQILADAGLVVVRTEGFGNRDTFISIETERRMGFDVRLRTRHSDSNPIEYIETIN